MAAPIATPPQQHSTTTPADTIATFAPPESRRHHDCLGAGYVGPNGTGPGWCGDGFVTHHSLLACATVASGQSERSQATLRQQVRTMSRGIRTNRRDP
ncbi:hypothetical protein GCM10022379_04310 [Micromonospora maritima]